jgi:hypothetical protein
MAQAQKYALPTPIFQQGSRSRSRTSIIRRSPNEIHARFAVHEMEEGDTRGRVQSWHTHCMTSADSFDDPTLASLLNHGQVSSSWHQNTTCA